METGFSTEFESELACKKVEQVVRTNNHNTLTVAACYPNDTGWSEEYAVFKAEQRAEARDRRRAK